MFSSPARKPRAFKGGLNSPAARSKRTESAASVRKQKREEGLRKRRQLTVVNNFVGQEGEIEATVESLPTLARTLGSVSLDRQTEVTKAVRKLLSKEVDPPVKEVLEAQMLPHLLSFLKRTDCIALQFEAAWAVTNIASTEYTSVVVEHDAVPLLVPLLRSPCPNVREQVAWCLGNIAGDCESYRDIVLETDDVVEAMMLNIVHEGSSESMRRNVVWAFSNLCRGKSPQPDITRLAPSFPVLANIAQHEKDAEAAADAIWALSYLTDGDNDRINAVVSQPGLCEGLVAQIEEHHATPPSEPGAKICVPALRTLGNIVTGSDRQTQLPLDAGLLRAISLLLQFTQKKGIKKEACWAASNVTAGTPDQVGAFLCTPNLPELVMHALNTDDWDVRKEAAYCVANVCTTGRKEHVTAMVERHEASEQPPHWAVSTPRFTPVRSLLQVVQPLCDLLAVQDTQVVLHVLDALKSLLAERYADVVDECGGLDAIEELQNHECENVYNKAIKIVERFFHGEEEEDENLAPNMTDDGSAFSFSAAKAPLGAAPLQFNFGSFAQ